MAGTWGLGLPQENMFPAQIFENGPFNCAQGGQRERQVCYGFIGTLYVGPPDCLYMLSDITEKKSRPPKVYVVLSSLESSKFLFVRVKGRFG